MNFFNLKKLKFSKITKLFAFYKNASYIEIFHLQETFHNMNFTSINIFFSFQSTNVYTIEVNSTDIEVKNKNCEYFIMINKYLFSKFNI